MMKNVFTLIVATVLVASASLGVARAADWQAGAGPEWRKVLAAAKEEGTVVVAGPPQLSKAFSEGFLRDTGLALDYIGGEARATASRVSRELRAGKVTVDVMLSGTAELPLVKEGYFEDEKARMLLPGVTNPKNWSNGEMRFVDNANKYMLRTHAYRSAIPYYNSEKVKAEEMKTWQDLLDPKFKGKIVVYDPRSGGPGRAMATYVSTHFGLDFFKKLYVDQEVVYSLDSRQMAEWVARGVHLVGLGILTPDYLRFRDQGITSISPTEFSDGAGTLSGGFSVILLPKGAPHPNAATVFLNWYASQPGQEAFSRAYKAPSLRTDVKVEGIADYVVPKPGRKYQDQYTEEWAMSGVEEVRKKFVEIIGGK